MPPTLSLRSATRCMSWPRCGEQAERGLEVPKEPEAANGKEDFHRAEWRRYTLPSSHPQRGARDLSNRPLRIHDSQGAARSSRNWRARAMPWEVGRCIGLGLPLKPDSN